MVEDSGALVHVPELLLMEPQLTHQIAGYLYAMSEKHASEVDSTILTTLGGPLSKWKSIWLCYALSNPQRELDSPWGAVSLNPAVAEWLKMQAASGDEVLSSQAVWALAANQSLDFKIWTSLNIRSGVYSTQYAAAALSKLPIPNKAELDSGDQFDAIVRLWAESL